MLYSSSRGQKRAHLGDGEGLRHETLDLASTLDLYSSGVQKSANGLTGSEHRSREAFGAEVERRSLKTHGKLVLLGKLVHSENGNDILETV